MSQERGNAMVVAALLMGLLLAQLDSVNSKRFTVGGRTGWSFGVAGWENGKNFTAGDTLLFKYGAESHNVVVLKDKGSYESCGVPSDAKTYNSGNDKLRLRKGANYFICGIPGHCDAAMKIAPIAS